MAGGARRLGAAQPIHEREHGSRGAGTGEGAAHGVGRHGAGQRAIAEFVDQQVVDIGQGDTQEFLHLFLAHQLEVQPQPRQHAEFGECSGVAQPALKLRRGLVGQPRQQPGEPDQPRVQGGEDLGLWVGRAVGQPRLAVLDHRVQAVGGQGHGRQLGSPQRDAPAHPQLTGYGGIEVVEQVRHPGR